VADRIQDPLWPLFDRIIALGQEDPSFLTPWTGVESGHPVYSIDEVTLSRLLGVPLLLGKVSQSGQLAKALDVWCAHELRRAGFDSNQVWPRATPPRVLPEPVSKLIESLPKDLRQSISERVYRDDAISGVTSANANVLGKLYQKQVDTGMARWHTGPEVLISTKRMDSSFGNNAKNRAEESYGDAKNLRLRYPLAALGFVFALRNTILVESVKTYRQMVDALTKLGEEEDAYHATNLLMIEYSDSAVTVETPDPSSTEALDAAIEDLPSVTLDYEHMPDHLSPNMFFTKIINRVLDVTPNDYHEKARELRGLRIGGVTEA
jgi:hypothetical protein